MARRRASIVAAVCLPRRHGSASAHLLRLGGARQRSWAVTSCALRLRSLRRPALLLVCEIPGGPFSCQLIVLAPPTTPLDRNRNRAPPPATQGIGGLLALGIALWVPTVVTTVGAHVKGSAPRTASSVPYRRSNCAARFGPTPGAPGNLSDGSPRSGV
jgi:hypothetical protein